MSKTSTVRTVLREIQRQERPREQGVHTHQHQENRELEALLEIIYEKKLDFSMLMEMDLSE